TSAIAPATTAIATWAPCPPPTIATTIARPGAISVVTVTMTGGTTASGTDPARGSGRFQPLGPVADQPFQHLQRNGAGGQGVVMEAPDVEAVAQRRPGLLAGALPHRMTQLVAAGLPRPDAVPFDLGGQGGF